MKHMKRITLTAMTALLLLNSTALASEEGCLTLFYSQCVGSEGGWLYDGCNVGFPSGSFGSWYVTGITYSWWPLSLTDAIGGGYHQAEFPMETKKVTCWTAVDIRVYTSYDCTPPFVDLGSTSAQSTTPLTVYDWPSDEFSCAN